MADKNVGKEKFIASLRAHNEVLVKPMNEKHMSNYFEGDVLETAKKAIKEIRRKAREDLKTEIEEDLVLKCRIVEMMDDKVKRVEEYQQQGPAWRFSGVPKEDLHSVQWMVAQEREEVKRKQVERIQARNNELKAELEAKNLLLTNTQQRAQREYESLVGNGSSSQRLSPEV